MKSYIFFALIAQVLAPCGCFAQSFIVINKLDIPVYCDLDSDKRIICDFHFDTNFPDWPKGSIPPHATVENGTGWECNGACYLNVKIQAADGHNKGHIKADFLPLPLVNPLQCHDDRRFTIWRDGELVKLRSESYYDGEYVSLGSDVSMPWKDFYHEKLSATVKNIVNNSDAEIRLNSSAKKNGYGKIDLTIPANKQGTISELSGKKMNSITVPDETVGAGAIEFFIKRDNKDNRYEIYSMSGGNVHLRGPDANGNWADLVYDPGLNYALVTDQNKIPRLEPSK